MELSRIIKKNSIALIILILFLGLGLRVYWACQKEGLHCDDVASFAIAECDGAFPNPNVYVDPHMISSGQEIKRFHYIHDPSLKGALHDIKYMWHRTYDDNHTNFYYSILRISFVGMDTTDLSAIIKRATLLNLLFFVISYIFFFKLLMLYWRDSSVLVFTTLACFAFMVGGVDDTLFYRPYELQMATVMGFAYWLSKIQIALAAGTWRFSFRTFSITTISLTLMLWTGYLMNVLACVFGVFLLWKFYRRGQLIRGAFFFVGTYICALMLCWLLYQSFFVALHGDDRVTSKFFTDGVAMRIWEYVVYWFKLIIHKSLYLYVLGAVLLIAIFSKKPVKHFPPVIIPALVYTVVAMQISPYDTNRYIVAVTPLLLLVLPMVLECVINPAYQRVIAVYIILAYMIMPMFESNFDYLFKRNPTIDLLADRTCNIHIVQDKRWKSFFLVAYLEDDIVYELSDDIKKCDIRQGDLLLNDAELPDAYEHLKLAYLGSYQKHYFYRVKSVDID